MTRPRGFTLIEAIAVIAITGIIASVVAVFVARPVQGYVDSVRRALLSDAADTALRRIGRDIRTAVPNSVRVTGANRFVEFVPTNDGGRYRVEQAGGAEDVLEFNTLDTSFEVFGVSPIGAVANDYFVIFNTGQCSNAGCTGGGSCIGADAYEGCNRRTITNVTPAGISFTATANPLPFDSPAHRFQVVPNSGPVMYACENVNIVNGNGTGTLRRYTRYAMGGGVWTPIVPDDKGSLLADSVSDCTFTYTGVTVRDGLVTLALTLTRSNESVTLYHEVHVDNQP